jgi:hypothetical protein
VTSRQKNPEAAQFGTCSNAICQQSLISKSVGYAMSTQLSELSQIAGLSAAALSDSDRGQVQAREGTRAGSDIPPADGERRAARPQSPSAATVPALHAIENFPTILRHWARAAQSKNNSRRNLWSDPRDRTGSPRPAGIVFVMCQRAVTKKSDERLSCLRKP